MILHWSANPIIFSWSFIDFRWYSLCWLAAFLIGDAVGRNALKRKTNSDVDFSNLLLFSFLGAVIGARVAHCLIYDPAYYWSNPLHIFAIWEGGLASHGGAIGLIAGLWMGIRRLSISISFVALLDIIAMPAAIGAALIRIGNFINSEVVGKATADSHYGVIFEKIDNIPRHPVQLYESLVYICIFAVLFILNRVKPSYIGRGIYSGIFLIGVFTSRIILEYWKAPQAAYEAGYIVSVGQWLSIPFVVLGLMLIIFSGNRRDYWR